MARRAGLAVDGYVEATRLHYITPDKPRRAPRGGYAQGWPRLRRDLALTLPTQGRDRLSLRVSGSP